MKESKESRHSKETKESREKKDTKDTKDTKESKETRTSSSKSSTHSKRDKSRDTSVEKKHRPEVTPKESRRSDKEENRRSKARSSNESHKSDSKDKRERSSDTSKRESDKGKSSDSKKSERRSDSRKSEDRKSSKPDKHRRHTETSSKRVKEPEPKSDSRKSSKSQKKEDTPEKPPPAVVVPVIEEDLRYEEADYKPFTEEDELEHDPLPADDEPSQVESANESTSSDSKKPSMKFKKKFLSAGLFSNYYKESGSDKATRKSDDHSEGLLPPPAYCEKYFRRTEVEFQLPYDLWSANENRKLPGRDTVPSWNFRKIRTNVYCDVRANPSSDHQPCSCKPESGCGDDCLNRMVYTECSPETCPCGDKCQNTKIQRHIIAPSIDRFMTAHKGWGVRTKQPVKKGTYILEYVGEVVTDREFKERMATLYTRDTHHYCLHLDGGLVIDGHRMGSDCRFVNHSCSPNCEMQKWSVNGLSRMALFAMRDINPGEELTYDYNFSLFNPAEGQPCKCESPQCRGVIGGKSQRVKPIDIKVSPMATAYFRNDF